MPTHLMTLAEFITSTNQLCARANVTTRYTEEVGVAYHTALYPHCIHTEKGSNDLFYTYHGR